MLIKQFINRGEIHKDFCEDFLLNKKLNEKYHLFGVFDGCSGGIDSHFASTLLAKIISEESKFIKKNNKKSLSELLKKLIRKTAKKLSKIQKQLHLQTDELLSTIVLLLVDTKNNKAEIIAIGDGYISVNYTETIIDQENKPSYLAYYLKDIKNKENFAKWYDENVTKINADNFSDLTISTDGILTFRNRNAKPENDIKPIEFLVKDDFLIKNSAMLSRKSNILKNKHNYVNFDDLAMFRIIRK